MIPPADRPPRNWCTRVLDPVCARLSGRVRLLSAFRTQTLNRLMGGAFDGAHVFGQAVDLMVDGVSAPDVARTLAAMPDLPFDTLFLVRRALQNGDHCAYVTLSHRRLGGNRRHVGTRSMGAAGTLQEDVGLPAPGPAHATNLSTAA